MSIGYTYVRAVDGEFYRDPQFRGPGWFICFDEDEPPEIVIAGEDKATLTGIAVSVLRDLGFRFEHLRFNIASGRCVGKNGRIEHACAFWFDLKWPIPVPPNQEPTTKRPLYGTIIDHSVLTT